MLIRQKNLFEIRVFFVSYAWVIRLSHLRRRVHLEVLTAASFWVAASRRHTKRSQPLDFRLVEKEKESLESSLIISKVLSFKRKSEGVLAFSKRSGEDGRKFSEINKEALMRPLINRERKDVLWDMQLRGIQQGIFWTTLGFICRMKDYTKRAVKTLWERTGFLWRTGQGRRINGLSLFWVIESSAWGQKVKKTRISLRLLFQNTISPFSLYVAPLTQRWHGENSCLLADSSIEILWRIERRRHDLPSRDPFFPYFENLLDKWKWIRFLLFS